MREPVSANEAIKRLANEIRDVIQEFGAFDRFQKMVLRWYSEQCGPRAAQEDFLRRRDIEYALRVQEDERLRDKDAGPPGEGWRWEMFHLHKALDDDPLSALVEAWVPPELSWANCPKVWFPLPLPDRELSLPEKYAVLAAIHDVATRSTVRINPWDRSNDPARMLFSKLKLEVADLTADDVANLRGVLGEVRDDLAGKAPRWLSTLLERIDVAASASIELDDDQCALLEAYVRANEPSGGALGRLREHESRRDEFAAEQRLAGRVRSVLEHNRRLREHRDRTSAAEAGRADQVVAPSPRETPGKIADAQPKPEALADTPAGSPPGESVGPQGSSPPAPTHGDEHAGRRKQGQRELPPSRTKAAAVYEWALAEVPGADDMILRELYAAILDRLDGLIARAHPETEDAEKLQKLRDSLPKNAETFGKYLREAGIKRYNTKGERIRRMSHFKGRDQV